MSGQEIREERIREAAYFLWEEAGCPDGRAEEFWLAAEKWDAEDDEADTASEDSFPASDPPANTGITGPEEDTAGFGFSVIVDRGTCLDGFHFDIMEDNPSPCVVLLVEDEALIRILAVEVLEEANFEVIEAASADEAVRILERQSAVHLVFTDVTLPGSMDGFDLAHHVRKHWPHVGILVTSGRPRPAGKLPKGCHFIPKPYDLGDVVRHAHQLTPEHCP